MKRWSPTLRLVTLLAFASIPVAGCQHGSEPDAHDAPECTEVWVEGQMLPKDYAGCRETGDSRARSFTSVLCIDGKYEGFDQEARRLVTYRQFWAVTGEAVHLETNGDLSSKEPEDYC